MLLTSNSAQIKKIELEKAIETFRNNRLRELVLKSKLLNVRVKMN